ncbi:MAG: hypothetical protein ACOX3K_01985 [Bacilli bacterium]
MSKIDDKKIKALIKEKQTDPKINLTSAEILKLHKIRQEEKKKRQLSQKKKSLWLFPSSLLLVASAAIAAVIIIKPNQPGSSSSSEIIIPPITYQDKIPGGQKGEFAFMTASALAFSDTDNILFKKPEVMFNNSSSIGSIEDIETTLDYTMPLIETLTEVSSGFNFEVEEGEFEGEIKTYAYRILLTEEFYILCNMEFEEDEEETETEIEGELHTPSAFYMIEGEKEVDTLTQETDLSINVHLSESKMIAIESEHENDEQEFIYEIYEDDELVFYLEIETEVEDELFYISVLVEQDGEELAFIVKVIDQENYYLESDHWVITVEVIGPKTYIYHREE